MRQQNPRIRNPSKLVKIGNHWERCLKIRTNPPAPPFLPLLAGVDRSLAFCILDQLLFHISAIRALFLPFVQAGKARDHPESDAPLSLITTPI
jgi:hypothetical protein